MSEVALRLGLFFVGLVLCVAGSMLGLCAWAATQAPRHSPPGNIEEVLPLRGKHLATAATPLLGIWSASTIVIGLVVGTFGILPVFRFAYDLIRPLASLSRLSLAVMVSAALCYLGVRLFRIAESALTPAANRAREQQRVTWPAFCRASRDVGLLWCAFALMAFGVVLSYMVSQIYP
jgi:hypothetical protein